MSKNQAATARVRLTAHSTNISNVIILGYHELSDGAKLTYMVLESYDWPDENGFSKGKCWPTIESLAEARGKSYDTIARHLKELEGTGLIRVESGRERGAANCYWLLEPSSDETQLYINRYSKPTPALRIVPPTQAVPQESGTPSRESTPPGNLFLQDKEPESSQESNPKKKDSNLFRMSGPVKSARLTTVEKTTHSPYLARLMDDFSRTFNDTEHSVSNRTQLHNLFCQSGLDEPVFTKVLYEAKKRTQWAALASATTDRSGPNRAAYFFKVVRDLLSKG